MNRTHGERIQLLSQYIRNNRRFCIYDFSDQFESRLEFTSMNEINDTCVSFPLYGGEGIRYVQSIDVASQHYDFFYMKYMITGPSSCSDVMLIYSNIGNNCMHVKNTCVWLNTLPSESYCYVKCECLNAQCNGTLLVENGSYQIQSVCKLQLG